MAVYAWADLHGRFDLLLEGLSHLGPEDKVYFLGDAADRGPSGWECIKYILADKRFTYIKGNHEDLLLKAIGSISPTRLPISDTFYSRDLSLWYRNGGQVTHLAIITDDTFSNEEKVEMIQQLKTLPFLKIYHNEKGQHVILSHSGYDDVDYGDEEDFIWDRTHWAFYNTWDGKEDEVIVHGHTPIELMIEKQEENAAWAAYDSEISGCGFDKNKTPKPWDGKSAYWYAKNHKCNIDTGAVWNNTSVLLNLDTWDEIIISTTPTIS